MKKLHIVTAVLTAAAILTSAAFAQAPVGVGETASAVVSRGFGEMNYESEEKILIDTLLGEEAASDNLTRGRFVYLAVRIARAGEGDINALLYSDVKADYKYAKEIAAALSQNWISAGEKFEPERLITPYEALKIAVCISGREYRAVQKGGWPDGYLAAAYEAGIAKNADLSGDTLGADMFYGMAFDMLNTKVPYVTNYGGQSANYKISDETMLENTYGIYSAEGIITETTYNSYDVNHIIQDDKSKRTIGINGTSMYYDELSEEYLGLNAKVYYKEKSSKLKAICVCPCYNDEFTIMCSELSLNSDGYPEYTVGSRQKVLKTSDGFFTVYNGRVCAADSSVYGKTGAVARFVDNNGDGIYEIVYIDAARYLNVQSFDSDRKIIIDTESADNNVYFDESHIRKFVKMSDGKNADFGSISNEVLAIWQSKDNKLLSIAICDKTVGGKIDAVENDDGDTKYYINGTEYRISGYINSYSDKISLGSDASYKLGVYGELAAVNSLADKWVYAYLVEREYDDGRKNNFRIKLFNENGIFETLDLADKIQLDDESGKKSKKEVFESGRLTPQFIKYSRNALGEVKAIDFSSDYNGGSVTDESLVCYWKNLSLQYKNTSKSLIPQNLAVGGAKIFLIPDDLDDEEKFEAGDENILCSGKTYNISGVFDVDEYKRCGALVIKSVDSTNLLRSNSYIIEKISSTVNEKGDFGRMLYCWSNGKYENLFLSDDVTVKKDSGNALCGGDIIRTVLKNGNEIAYIAVDVDNSGDMPRSNTGSGGSSLNSPDSNPGYLAGLVYGTDKNTVSLVADGGDPENIADRQALYASSEYIVRYNKNTKLASSVKLPKLRGYNKYGGKADYAVMVMNGYRCVAIIAYERD